jgi:tripartite-type tricarboxylate transporter receptor subunit TctC
MKNIIKNKKACTLFGMILLALLCSWIMAQGAGAQDYPARPIKLILGFPPGGPADNCSRVIAKRASEFLGQPIITEYKPGAGATLAPTFVAKSKPDGYTLWLGSATPALIAPLVKKDIGFTMDDFSIICSYAVSPCNFNVRNDGRWNNLSDFVADAKKNPGKYNYTAAAALSSGHFVVEAFSKMVGIKLNFIPYPGTAEANAAVLGGHVDLAAVGGTGGLAAAGRLKILAIATAKRVKSLPGIPTLTELGYPIAVHMTYFLSAPKETPKAVLDKLYDAHSKAFAKYGEEIDDLIMKYELVTAFWNPEEVLSWNKKEKAVYYGIAKDQGVLVNP